MFVKSYLFMAIISIFAPIFIYTSVLAATPTSVDPFKEVCNQQDPSNSAVCKDKNLDGGNPLYGPNGIITKIVNIISLLVGMAAIVSIIVAGIRYITSGNKPEDVNNARELIIYAAIGLAVAASAQLLVQFVLNKVL